MENKWEKNSMKCNGQAAIKVKWRREYCSTNWIDLRLLDQR